MPGVIQPYFMPINWMYLYSLSYILFQYFQKRNNTEHSNRRDNYNYGGGDPRNTINGSLPKLFYIVLYQRTTKNYFPNPVLFSPSTGLTPTAGMTITTAAVAEAVLMTPTLVVQDRWAAMADPLRGGAVLDPTCTACTHTSLLLETRDTDHPGKPILEVSMDRQPFV